MNHLTGLAVLWCPSCRVERPIPRRRACPECKKLTEATGYCPKCLASAKLGVPPDRVEIIE